jgi:hypothetical protein
MDADAANFLALAACRWAGERFISLSALALAAKLSLLAAILLFGFVGAPFAVASAVKISLD